MMISNNIDPFNNKNLNSPIKKKKLVSFLKIMYLRFKKQKTSHAL